MNGARPATVTLLIKNGSDTNCTLGGRPTVRIGGQALASPAADPHGAAMQYPATIGPGEPARVTLTLRDGCESRGGEVVSIMESGRMIPVSALRLEANCVSAVSAWYVEPPLLNVPHLVATIQAPETAARGEALAFLVTVRNTSDVRQDFGGCPVHVAAIGGRSESRKANCAVTSIGAGARVDYAMKLAVPRECAPGRVRLEWTLVVPDGHAVVADLADGGVPITVV